MSEIVIVRGERYRVVSRTVVQGNGVKFDGRVRFTLARESDGALFAHLGARRSSKPASNASLTRVACAYCDGHYLGRDGNEYHNVTGGMYSVRLDSIADSIAKQAYDQQNWESTK